jgi:rod shape-determining protein MreC
VYDKQVRRRRAVLALLVVVSLILLTAYFGESAGSPLHSVQRGVVTVLSPIQEGASRALKPVRDLFGWFGDTLHATQQRDQLKKQRDALLAKEISDQVLIQQNQQMSNLLSLDRDTGIDPSRERTGRIIARAPDNLFHDTLEIDVGGDDGVRVGQPVVAGGGLVGHISTVAGGDSFVTLITDQSSIVSARVLDGQSRGELGIVQPSVGDPLDLLVQQLPPTAPIVTGQPVVTAGSISSKLESLYPPNIPIGIVTKADPQELHDNQQIHIAPIADLRHLDFVQVLVTPPSGATQQAQVP